MCMRNLVPCIMTFTLMLSCDSHRVTDSPAARLPSLDRAKVFVAFDDCSRTVYDTAAIIMDQYGFKGNLFIPYSAIRLDDPPPLVPGDGMSWAEVVDLHSRGWGAYNHTWDHSHWADSTSINRCYELLVDWSLMQPDLAGFAYPYSDCDSAYIERVALNHEFARLCSTTFSLQPQFNLESPDIYTLRGVMVTSEMGVDSAKALIDMVEQERETLILVYHFFCNEPGCGVLTKVHIDDFAEVMAYLYEKRRAVDAEIFEEYLD